VVEYFESQVSQGNDGIKVVYIYFDHEISQTQTALAVAQSFLKQLIPKMDIIPSELFEVYRQCRRNSSLPTVNDMLRGLRWWLGKYQVYVVVDAIDECDHQNQAQVFELLTALQRGVCRILISSRPRLTSAIRAYLTITDLSMMEIVADMSMLFDILSTDCDWNGTPTDRWKLNVEHLRTKHKACKKPISCRSI
jgi:hypothetical protein